MSSRRKANFGRSSSIDEQFDAFLKASIGSDSDTSLSKYIQPKPKKETQWWQSSVDSSEDFDTNKESGGFGTTGKSFLKKKEKRPLIPPIAPKTPEADVTRPVSTAAVTKATDLGELRESSAPKYLDDSTGPFSARVSIAEPQRTSKLLTETEEFRESQLSFDQSTETGHETLEEAADKSRFFKKLHADAEGTLDYSRLNRQLGQTGNTSFFEATDAPERANQETIAESSLLVEDEEGKELEDGRPATYMGDEPPEDDPTDLSTRPNLLANVSLNDTLDTSLQATSAQAADVSGGMGNTSQLDYEAVHQAYQDVHDKEGTARTIPFTTQAAHEDSEAEIEQNEEEVPVWQNSSRRDGGSEGTSVWDLQPITETKDATLHSEYSSKRGSPSPSSSRHDLSASQRSGGEENPQPSVWDLEPLSASDLPPELVPIWQETREQAKDEVDWRDGRVTPPTALGYQTVDHLSPIVQDPEFHHQPSMRDSQTNTPSRRSLRKSMGKTQTLRRPTSANKSSSEKFGHIKSSGYGVVHPTPSRNRSSSPKVRSPKKAVKKKSPATSQKSSKKEPEPLVPKESSPIKVLQSVESFASYLRDQFVSSTPAYKEGVPYHIITEGASRTNGERETALFNEIREWQQKWREECRMREKVNADFMSAQKHWDMFAEDSRLKHEQQLGQLRQQVYILEAKASIQPGLNTGDAGKAASDVKETIIRLESEIQSQEKLISGYQLENEKLYKEMKQMDSVHKATYERLYQENHKQASELAKLREALSQREAELRMKGVHPITYGHPLTEQPFSEGVTSQQHTDTPMTAALGAGRIADLKTQLVKAKNDSGSLAAQVTVLTQKNSNLSSELEQLTKAKDGLKELLLVSKQPAELMVIQERYQQEINILEKRIRWYIDNQRILDTDVERLRQKDCEINQLNNRIKQLEEQKHKSYDGTQRTKDRAVDAKRIKDLERQVKEMEQIIRKRNPNSIPSLIWAASIMPDAHSKPPSMKFLEERVAQLEKELEEKDGDTSRLLRAMEQQCNQSKALYEQRIEELEQRPSQGNKSETSRHTTVTALEKDLQAAREQHRRKQQDLQSTIDSLREEVAKHKHKAAVELKFETRALRQSMEQTESLTNELQEQLNLKMKEIAALYDTIERLQKEKQQLLVELNHVQSVSHKPEMRGQSPPRRSAGSPSRSADGKTRVVSGMRAYEARDFTTEHISDVLAMNKQLRIKYEESQIEVSQLRVDHQRQLAQLEAQMRQEQADLQSQMKQREAEHYKEKEQLKARQALKQSDTELSKYKNEISSLETVIRHLKEDRLRWQTDTEELSALRIRNITLDSRIKSLEDQLEDAKEHHTPEMRHFERLKDKISSMEERFTNRETDLRRIISQNQVTYQEDLRLEVLKWKNIVHSKNKDIERFRAELDSILGVLKELRRQGVTIPLT